MTLDSIVDFIIYHMGGDREQLAKDILRHREFNTLTLVEDEHGIAGMVRFNIHLECAHVIQLIVREDLERKGILKLLVANSWHKFPYLKFFTFDRKTKYPFRKTKAYRIAQFV